MKDNNHDFFFCFKHEHFFLQRRNHQNKKCLRQNLRQSLHKNQSWGRWSWCLLNRTDSELLSNSAHLVCKYEEVLQMKQFCKINVRIKRASKISRSFGLIIIITTKTGITDRLKLQRICQRCRGSICFVRGDVWSMISQSFIHYITASARDSVP